MEQKNKGGGGGWAKGGGGRNPFPHGIGVNKREKDSPLGLTRLGQSKSDDTTVET